MAVESKPLFHPEVMRQQVRAFNLPERVAAWQPKLQHWASLIASGRADEFKETELLPDFLTDIFCGLLGYTGPVAEAGAYTLSRERHVEVDGEFADAVLGHFGSGRGAARTQPLPRLKSCAAPRSCSTAFCSALSAKTAACCPPSR